MKSIDILLMFSIVVSVASNSSKDKITNETIALMFLNEIDKEISEQEHQLAIVNYIFITNVTDENEGKFIKEEEKSRELDKRLWEKATKFDYQHFKDDNIRRRIRKLSILGTAALSGQEANHFTEVKANMERIYSSAKICFRGKCGLELEPDITELMANSRDYDQLEEVWNAWRDSAGKPMRHLYKEYVDLGKKVAILNGFKSMDELSLDSWETEDLKKQMSDLWQELRPIYQIFHTYVRMKLRQKYGSRMPSDGTIPAHLLGNVWAQQWTRILDMVVPFPNKKTLDITETMRKQNFTALKMFKMSEKFFTDLGLMPMTDEFWKNSLIVKPKNRTVVCHASASDMFDKKDFRIKMCTDITMTDFIVVHHEMGHIQYYMQYRDQPAMFKGGANPGFHEAVGDTIALSVSTPHHLYKVGLYSESDEDYETTINYQMSKALEKLSFLPFSYSIDLWRWDVFSGKVSYDEWNKRWWQLRLEYQGISPPNKRTETNFDPGAKYHIPASVEYIRYFVSFIIQFQFHKALCSIAQPNAPLHKCDIDGNKAAGAKLASALSLGASKRWPDVMEVLTGTRRMSAQPLIEYFDPLLRYLKNEIKNETIGWTFDVNPYVERKMSEITGNHSNIGPLINFRILKLKNGP